MLDGLGSKTEKKFMTCEQLIKQYREEAQKDPIDGLRASKLMAFLAENGCIKLELHEQVPQR